MGFTFVADRTSSSRLLSTFPRGNAVAGPSSLNGLISDMSFFISSGFEFQDRTERQRVGRFLVYGPSLLAALTHTTPDPPR